MSRFNHIFTEGSAFICKFTIDPNHREEFLSTFNKLWTDHIDVMERDCHFVFYGLGRDENELYCIESWKSEEATNKVRAEPQFQELVGRMIELSAAPMTLQILSGLEGDRSVFDLYPEGASERHPSAEGKQSTFS